MIRSPSSLPLFSYVNRLAVWHGFIQSCSDIKIKMSWQDYVDKNLVGSKHCSQGIIAGLDGNPWAYSAGLQINPADIKKIIAGFSDSSPLQASGIHVAGVRYFFLSGDDSIIRGKKSAGGLHCAKTNQGVIIGIYDENIQPGQCAVVVEKLAEYLKSQEY